MGEWIVRKKKEKIKIDVREGTVVGKQNLEGTVVGKQNLESQEIDARIVMYSPELAKELNVRSSRDRIARGVLVNVPFVGMATILYFGKNLLHSRWLYPAIGLTVMFTTLITLVIYRMWQKFQDHSYRYEVFAYQVVDEKLKAAAKT